MRGSDTKPLAPPSGIYANPRVRFYFFIKILAFLPLFVGHSTKNCFSSSRTIAFNVLERPLPKPFANSVKDNDFLLDKTRYAKIQH